MSIIMFLLIGLVVGVVTRWIVPREIWGGWITSIMLALFGAFFGGIVTRAFGLYQESDPASFVTAALGAVLMVGGFHALARGRSLPARR